MLYLYKMLKQNNKYYTPEIEEFCIGFEFSDFSGEKETLYRGTCKNKVEGNVLELVLFTSNPDDKIILPDNQ